MKTRRGDVVLVLFPNSDLRTAKRRPASSPDGKAARLRLDSVVMTDNLATIMESEIDSILGHLANTTKVNAALRHTLSI